MLLTRCPHCRTAFRVQADELEVAGGQVRCGRCAQVFDAYSDLQQLVAATGSGPDIAVANADPITEDPSVEPETVDSLLSEAGEDDAALPEEVPLTFEVLDGALEEASDVEEADAGKTPEPESAPDEETYTAIEREIDEALYGEHGRREREAAESDAAASVVGDEAQDLKEDSLEFDLPAGEWDEFFAATEAEGGFLAEAAKELADSASPEPQQDTVERADSPEDAAASEGVMSVEAWLDQQADSGRGLPRPETSTPDAEAATQPAAAPESAAEPSADPASVATAPEAAEAEQARSGATADAVENQQRDAEAEADAIVDSLADLDDAWDGVADEDVGDTSDNDGANAPDAAEEVTVSDPSPGTGAEDEGHVMDLTALAPATSETETPEPVSEAPAESEGWALDPFEEEDREETRSRWWPVAAAGLIVLLVGQLVHAGRHTLVEQPMLGPLLAKTYTALGAESPGRIDLGNYRLERWIATEKKTAPPSLAITAAVTNLGPRDQPLPLIRLELKDRWDDPVASRVFTPREYLGEDAPERALAPGASAEANLTIVDPGEEAYGFELDVCVGSAGGRLRCATDPQ